MRKRSIFLESESGDVILSLVLLHAVLENEWDNCLELFSERGIAELVIWWLQSLHGELRNEELPGDDQDTWASETFRKIMKLVGERECQP